RHASSRRRPCRRYRPAHVPEAASLRGSRHRRAPAQPRRDGPRSLDGPGGRARLRPPAAASPRYGAVALTQDGATKWADIDSSAITSNTSLVKQLVGEKTAVMAVVK